MSDDAIPCRESQWKGTPVMGSTRNALLLILALSPLAPACADQPTQAQSGAIAMSVTEGGFEPDRIKVKRGQPVRLVITRKTDATCAKAIVIDEYHIHADLPLDKPVTVTFTPSKSGQLKYGCAMDKMVSGVLIVE
jgi:plastocyanin domain-containing protein